MATRWDIVGLGACGVDLRVRVPKLPTHNHKVGVDAMEVLAGGVTSNNLVQTARLGLKVAWIGALGNDEWKTFCLQEFRSVGITPKPVLIKGFSTQQFWIAINPEGEWMILGVGGATRQLTAAHVRKNFASVIRRARHFHTEVAAIKIAPALEGAKIARRNKVRVLVDIDDDPWYLLEKEKFGTRADFLALLKHTDVAKMSMTGALGLTRSSRFGPATMKKVLKLGPSLVVVTSAEKGCYLATREKIIHCPGVKVKPVDTVGAGDAFMGGLSYGLLKGWDLKKIGALANACGAFKCTQFGTRSSGKARQIQHLLRRA